MPVRGVEMPVQRGVSFIRVKIINDVKCLCLLPKDLNFFLVISPESHSIHFFPFCLTTSAERRKDWCWGRLGSGEIGCGQWEYRDLLKVKKNTHTPQKNLSLKRSSGSALAAPWIFNQRPSHITRVLMSLDWYLNIDKVTWLYEAPFISLCGLLLSGNWKRGILDSILYASPRGLLSVAFMRCLFSCSP